MAWDPGGQGLSVQDVRVQGLGLVGLRRAQGSRSRAVFCFFSWTFCHPQAECHDGKGCLRFRV